MTKYDFEFKKKVVEAYLRDEGGYQTLSKRYGLKSTRQIGYWVKAYKKFGDEGLKVLENGRVYPFELKLLVVESYLKGNYKRQSKNVQKWEFKNVQFYSFNTSFKR